MLLLLFTVVCCASVHLCTYSTFRAQTSIEGGCDETPIIFAITLPMLPLLNCCRLKYKFIRLPFAMTAATAAAALILYDYYSQQLVVCCL